MPDPVGLPVIAPRIVPFGLRSCLACKHWLPPYSLTDPRGWCDHESPRNRANVTGIERGMQLKGGCCSLFEARKC